MCNTRTLGLWLVCFILPLSTSVLLQAQDRFEGHVITPKGAWCWFADPRAIHHRTDYIHSTYIGYIDVHGNIKATQHDFNTGLTHEVLIRSYFQPDDHNNPTFLILPDQRVMIFYSRHTDEACFYYRVSTKPGDITSLGPEFRLATNHNTTYPSAFILSDDPNNIYLCWRGINWHPTIARLNIPDANGHTQFNWGPFQIVQSTAARPYAKYHSNGKDRINIAYTLGHPDNENPNFVYFNYFDVNTKQLRDIQGKVLSTVGVGVHQVSATSAYLTANPNAVVENASFRNWIWQVTTDDQGNPVLAIVRINADRTNHQYFYATWTGTQWRRTFIANGGGRFHQTPGLELSYSGGMAIDDANTNIVYCSVPIVGTFGTVFEIWKYVMAPNGTVASSQAITRNSRLNNVRPFVIPNTGNSPLQLTWMHGNYFDWIVSSVRPQGYPTAIHTNFDGLANTQNIDHQLVVNEEFNAPVNGSATSESGVLVTTNNTHAVFAAPNSNAFSISLTPYLWHGAYYGEILRVGNLIYSIDSASLKPVVHIGNQAYRSSNVLGTSDVWQTQPRSTNGVWYPPSKHRFFNLTLTFQNNTLTVFRNGLIDQRIESTAFEPGEINIGRFIGWVEDFRLYERAINQQEVKKLSEISNAYPVQNALIADTELKHLSVPATIYTDLILPSTTASGIAISWTSQNPQVLSSNGLVTFPSLPTRVTLTASVGNRSNTFHTTVMPRDILQNRTLWLTFNSEDTYTLNNQRFIRDKSGNNNDVRVFGSAQVNGQLDLRANTPTGFTSNGYALAPIGILRTLRSATFLMRITPTSLSNQPRVFDFGSASANSIFLRANAFSAGYKFNDNTTILVHSPTQLATSQTAWVAMTFDARTKITRLFLNGTPTVSSTSISMEPWQLTEVGADHRNYIGRTQWWDSSVANSNIDFQGTIDDFMVFDAVLTVSEMEQVLQTTTYNRPITNANTYITPNPAKKGSILSLRNPANFFKAELFNSIGQNIDSFCTLQSTLSLSSTTSSGVYFVKLHSTEGIKTLKLLIE